MAEVAPTEQKIEPGTTGRLVKWTEAIGDREDEVIGTLENEGMHLEAAFVKRTDEAAFLVYSMTAGDVDVVREAFDESDHEIDREHRDVLEEFLESPGRVGDYAHFYWVRNPERPSSKA